MISIYWDTTPLYINVCVVCQEVCQLPWGEYDVCGDCYFKLCDEAEAEE